MMKVCRWAMVVALCFSFVGCHGDSTTHHPAVIKELTSVEVDSNNCTFTVCGLIKLGTRNGVPVNTTVHIYLGDAGMTVEDLLASPSGFLVESVTFNASEADDDGVVEACVTAKLPPGERPVLVRASTGARFGTFVSAGLVEGLAPSGIANLSCRVVGTDVVLNWENLSPVAADEIEILLRPGSASEESTTVEGTETSLTLPGFLSASVSDLIRLIAHNKYGSAEAVECMVARPGTPLLHCQLVNDEIVLTWESEANSVELFENGISLGTFEGNGTLELSDRNPATYVFTAIGTGLEDQPEAVSDTARCELHRKARLLLTAPSESEQEVYNEGVLRVLVDGAPDLPVFVNAKVLTLELEETEEESPISFGAYSRGSCSFFDVFFDIDYETNDNQGPWSVEVLSLELNGVPQEFDEENGEGELDGTFRVDAPGPIEVVVTAQASREVSVDDTTDTEIVALSLSRTANFIQHSIPLFGDGNHQLRLPSSAYADAFLTPSNVGNRIYFTTELIEGSGHGIGYGSGSGEGYGYGYGIGEGHGGGDGFVKVFGEATVTLPGISFPGFSIPSVSLGEFCLGDLGCIDLGSIPGFTLPGFPLLHPVTLPIGDVVASGGFHVPVWTDVYTDVSTEVHTYVSTEVYTDVIVQTPIEVRNDLDAEEVTYLAGHTAVGSPDCRGFGIGREAGHLSLAFCDNIVVDGPGYDVRIFERAVPESTDSFFLHTYLDKLYNINRNSWTGRAPSFEKGPEFINLPVDQNVPTDTLGLGYRAYSLEESERLFGYDCGHVIDLDLAALGIECLNMTTFVSAGEGNTIQGDFSDLFAGAEIDSVCGLHNIFGLRVCPIKLNEEEPAQRDLFVEHLFDTSDVYEQKEETLWKYDLCGVVYCDGLKGPTLETNVIRAQSYVDPYYMRHILKQEDIFNLEDFADQNGLPFGLEFELDD